MTARQKLGEIQKILGGISVDETPGPRTRAALDNLMAEALREMKASLPRKPNGAIISSPGWSFSLVVDGEDLVMRNVNSTAFGGGSDAMDSGETASGISTKKFPNLRGAALPMRRDASSALRGSPVPKLPWGTKVVFTRRSDGKSVETELVDEGPANWTGNAADMTVAAAKTFMPTATANNFKERLDVRIVGGAKYV